MADRPEREARVFHVDSRFVRMARRPGGVTREQAMADAQAHIEELKTEFADWLDRELDGLRTALAQLEIDPSDMTMVDHANSNCLQLRDLGATMGFELISFVAESLCAILETIKAGAAYDKDMIDCHIDALFLVKTDKYRELTPGQVPEMSSGLRRIVELATEMAPRAPRRESIQLIIEKIQAPRSNGGAG
jgi:chemotaxis protein histidine kinase CheA